MVSCNRSVLTTTSRSDEPTPPKRSAASARLIVLFVLLLAASTGCMREREEPATPTWVEEVRASSFRRYSVRDNDRKLLRVLKRRGTTTVLSNAKGNLLAKVSLRRHKKQVLLRQSNGTIAGRTLTNGDLIEVLDSADHQIASLRIDRRKKIVVFSDHEDKPVRVFEIHTPDEVLSRAPFPGEFDDETMTPPADPAPKDPVKATEAPANEKTAEQGDASATDETSAEERETAEAVIAPEAEDEAKAVIAPEAEDEAKAVIAPEAADEAKAVIASEVADEGKAVIAPEAEDEGKAVIAPEVADEAKAVIAPEAEDEAKAAIAPEVADEGKAAIAPETVGVSEALGEPKAVIKAGAESSKDPETTNSEPLRAAEISKDEGADDRVEGPLPPFLAKVVVSEGRRRTIHWGPQADSDPTLVIEHGSDLGALGIALLETEGPSQLFRLALAVHVAELIPPIE